MLKITVRQLPILRCLDDDGLRQIIQRADAVVSPQLYSWLTPHHVDWVKRAVREHRLVAYTIGIHRFLPNPTTDVVAWRGAMWRARMEMMTDGD
jgi:hypothetical protein